MKNIPARSTLSDALNLRNWRIYHELAMRLIARARTLYAEEPHGIELDATVYALDATTIDLYLSLFDSAPKTAPLLTKGSAIVATTSFLNEVGTPGLSILSASQAAVRSLGRSLGTELAPRGIRINAVSPGPHCHTVPQQAWPVGMPTG